MHRKRRERKGESWQILKVWCREADGISVRWFLFNSVKYAWSKGVGCESRFEETADLKSRLEIPGRPGWSTLGLR